VPGVETMQGTEKIRFGVRKDIPCARERFDREKSKYAVRMDKGEYAGYGIVHWGTGEEIRSDVL